MIKRLLKLVSSNWDKKTMLLVSEDFRKIGTYILGIAFVAMFVQNDNISATSCHYHYDIWRNSLVLWCVVS